MIWIKAEGCRITLDRARVDEALNRLAR